MTAFGTFLTDAFDDALDVMGETCTVEGTSCNGVWSQIDVSSDITETGYQPSADASVSISKTDFAASPNARGQVIRDNTNYTITHIEENESGWVLTLLKDV